MNSTAVAVASDVLGRAVSAEQIPLDEYALRFQGELNQDSMMHMMSHHDRVRLLGGNALVLRATLGREPGALGDYLGELSQLAPR